MPRMTSRAPAATAEDADTPPWALPILRGPRYSQSLERGLAILGCFTSEHPVLGIADIADELGMSRSTTHRYVTTLLALGYLEQGRSRKYRLGLRVTDLGMSALNSTGLRENVHPFLEELRERTGYTIGLAVLDGSEILYVDSARSWRRAERETDLRPASGLTDARVLHGDGQGPARLPAGRGAARAYRAVDSWSATPQARSRASRLCAHELERIAENGYALNDQELRPGLQAIAVPVRDESTRGCRRGRHRRKPRSDLARGADRRARSAPDLHRRPHLLASGLPARRRAVATRAPIRPRSRF